MLNVRKKHLFSKRKIVVGGTVGGTNGGTKTINKHPFNAKKIHKKCLKIQIHPPIIPP